MSTTTSTTLATHASTPSRRRLWLLRVLTVLTTAILAVAGTTQTAQASAYGASYFGPGVTWKGITVRMGTYHAYISGSGTYVSYVKGWPQLNTPIGNICNWNITAEFFDANGRWYSTRTGPTHWGCNSYWNQANADFLYVNGYVQRGTMCSTLKSNGARQTSVCHSIS